MPRRTKKKTVQVRRPREIDQLRAELEESRPGGVVSGSEIQSISVIPTGAFILDYALAGGIPEGKASIFYGVDGCGKSTLLYLTMAQAQRKHPEGHVFLCDPENNYDPVWGEACGIDPERFHRYLPEHCQDAIDVMEGFANTEEVVFIGLDSIAALFTKGDVEDSAEDAHVAERARALGVFYSKMLGSWATESKRGHKVTVGMVNQLREKIGVMFGDPRTMPGGKAVNYYMPRVRVELLKQAKEYTKDPNTDVEVPDHNLTRFKLNKEKGGVIKSGEFKINLNPANENGVPIANTDDYDTVTAYSKRWGIVHGGGQSWKIQDSPMTFKNLKELKRFLTEEPEVYLRLKQLCIAMQREAAGLPPLPPDGYLYGYLQA